MQRHKTVCGFFCAFVSAIALAPAAASAKETVLYSFQGTSDGQEPYGSLVADKHGNLFGVTNLGGTGSCTSFLGGGCGTVFELSKQGHGNWVEKVLYSFQGGSDGQYPQAPLVIGAHDKLYGTTSQGGTGSCTNFGVTGCGTVFELSRQDDGSWSESVLYSFQGVPSNKGDGDGAAPNSVVFDASGNLFGFTANGGTCTTEFGNTFCDGAAFELHKHKGVWQETVIYRADDSTAIPAGATFDAQGNLYGESPFAGEETVGDVFRLIPPAGNGLWTAQVLYTFQNQNDGAFPSPGFVFDAQGNLYGSSGGTDSVASNVFELTPTVSGPWTESVVFDFFDEGIDLEPAQGPIMDSAGNLYGATNIGGVHGKGLVYKLSLKQGSWTLNVLHDFRGGSDGSEPLSGVVIGKDGALYGTTSQGGTGSCNDGCGTAFRVTR